MKKVKDSMTSNQEKEASIVSIMSGLCQGKLIAPLTFEGSCNRKVFAKWLEEKLLPQVKSGKMLILDNASFHKGEEIRKIVEEAGCKLQYLPPYSPDLNKIENYWFPIKNQVRKSKGSLEDFRERVDNAVKLASVRYASTAINNRLVEMPLSSSEG